MFKKLSINYLIFCWFALPLLAQPEIKTIKHFGTAEGLNIPHITRIYEDDTGALWLFTYNRDGFVYGVGNIWEVAQFDGKEFFYPEGWFSDSLYSKDMVQFNDNQLLIKYNHNFFDVFDTDNRTIQRVSLEPHFPAYDYHFLEWKSRNDIAIIHNGGSRTCLSSWEGKLDILCEVPSQKTAIWQAGIFRNKEDIWWSAAGAGFFKFNSKTSNLKRYKREDFLGLALSPLDSIGLYFEIAHQTPHGNFLFALSHRQPAFYQYNSSKDNFEPLAGLPQDLACNFIYKDEAGRLLLIFGSYYYSKAIWLMDLDGSLHNYSGILAGLIDHRVNWYHSKNFKENLWAATSNGLTFLEFENGEQDLKKFQTYSSFRGCIELESGKVLFATDNDGWFLWEEGRDTLIPFIIHRDGIRQPLFYSRGFFLDKNGSFWATDGIHILKVDASLQLAEFFEAPFQIQSITRLENEHFLIAGKGDSQLTLFNPKEKNFRPYLSDTLKNPLENKFCHSIYEASDGIIWVGTSGGLVKFDPQNQSTSIYTTEDGLGNNTIMFIHEEPDGKLWLATADSGINIFDPEEKSFSFLQKKDGLVDNTVAGILKDRDGDFWFMTFNGLSCYDPITKTFLNFSTPDGFSHHEFNRFAFYEKPNGQFCLGTIQGMNVFDPLALKQKNATPKLILQEAEYFDIEQNQSITRYHNLSDLKEITLPPFERYLRLRFRLSELINAEKHQFASYLEGFDKDWNDFNFRNEVVFNNLPAGDYTLHLRGINESGKHNENPISINIRVEEYYYKKGWFLALCLLTFMSAIYALYRYRIHQVYQMMEMRTKIASDLHDDVGGLLTAIAMQSELLQLDKSIKDQSRIEKIRQISQNAIAQMRDLVWSIDARRDKLEYLFDRMREYAGETLQAKGLGFKLNTTGLDLTQKLPIEVRQNLFLIFKEAVTNTLRHSSANKIEVSIRLESKYFEMRIQDNGTPNKNLEKLSTGLGLSNMKRRAEKMKGIVEFEHSAGFGIVVSVPIK